MSVSPLLILSLPHCLWTAGSVMVDFGCLIGLLFRSRSQLAAENLFLRKQLALFQERKVKPRRAVDATR